MSLREVWIRAVIEDNFRQCVHESLFISGRRGDLIQWLATLIVSLATGWATWSPRLHRHCAEDRPSGGATERWLPRAQPRRRCPALRSSMKTVSPPSKVFSPSFLQIDYSFIYLHLCQLSSDRFQIYFNIDITAFFRADIWSKFKF